LIKAIYQKSFCHTKWHKSGVPYVPHRGNCSLKEAAEPILAMVEDYIEKNPGKPVILIGTSNGGRIAAYIETKLRHLNVAIRVAGIAGAFFGSTQMNLLKTLGIAPLFLKSVVIEELEAASLTARQLIEEMRRPVVVGKRSYEFYATANDLYIPNFSFCFPKLAGAKYHLLKGYDHVSLAGRVCRQELKRSFAWMDGLNFTNDTLPDRS
jgi:hypothetical protein